MSGVHRKILGTISVLILTSWAVPLVHAEDYCLMEVLSQPMEVYADLSKIILKYKVTEEEKLSGLKAVALTDGKLKEKLEFTLSSGKERTGIHLLEQSLIVRQNTGQRFRLLENTLITYALPANLPYKISIPAGTVLSTVTSGEYALEPGTDIEVFPPTNYQLTLKIDPRLIVERIPGTSGLGTTLDLNPKWAPVGGYIRAVIAKTGFDFTNAQFQVALRPQGNDTRSFVPSTDVELVEVQPGKATLQLQVPDIGESIIWPKAVDLLVSARGPEGKLAEVVSREFSVSSQVLAVIVSIAALLVSWFIIAIICYGKDIRKHFLVAVNPISWITNKYGCGSLSLAQILLWTLLVFSASFYVLFTSGKLLAITNDVLVLLGIAGASSVIVKIRSSITEEKGRIITNSFSENSGEWVDLFKTEGQLDLYKIQMALFTVLAAVFVTGTIFQTYQFPVLPAGLLTLIGISNGVYLTAKATSQSIYDKLAAKYGELQDAKNESDNSQKGAEDASKVIQDKEALRKSVEEKLNETQDRMNKESDDSKKENLLQDVKQLQANLLEAQADLRKAQDTKIQLDSAAKAAKTNVDKLNTEFEDLKKQVPTSGS
jgi:hypothetical protein